MTEQPEPETRTSPLARIKAALRQLRERDIEATVKEHLEPDPEVNRIEVVVAGRMPREMTSRSEVASYLEEATRWL